MDLSDRTKILLLLGLALFVIYLYVNNTKEPIENEGALTYDPDTRSPVDLNEDVFVDTENAYAESVSNDSEEEHNDRLMNRMRGKNASRDGEYKKSSYKDGERQASSSSLDRFFEEGDHHEQTSNDNYRPSDRNAGKFATYVAGAKRDETEEDKFDAGELLPKEEQKDWFEDVQAVSVKNKHLINIYRPVGVSTTAGSLRNPSWDIRGAPTNPKTVVSPWLMSTIEPDHNNKGLC